MDQHAPTLREQLLTDGWRQGSLFPKTHLVAVRWVGQTPLIGENDEVAVLTHSCDLLADKLATEPLVEVLLARPVAKTERKKLFGRNPRVFQWTDANGAAWEASIHERGTLDRKTLHGLKPAGALGDNIISAIRPWMSNRYARHAYPEEFNKRLFARSESSKRWDRIREACGPEIQDIFVGYDPVGDAAPDEPYRVLLRVVVDETVVNDTAEWDRVHDQVFVPLKEMFKSTESFALDDSAIVAADEITLADVMMLHRLDWDDASFGD